MSYTETYNGYVHYSGRVSYNYPASEHGGSDSVSYSGDEPVTFRVTVNTNPFDRSVSSCNRQLNELTGSVSAMNAAQVATIAATSRDISNHISGGFFTLIKSELSQNMAAAFSKIQGSMGLLRENASMLSTQHETMERDYNRIKGRYVKVFDDLDEECRRRIFELDKKVFELSEQVKDSQMFKDVTEATTKYLIPMNEGTIVNQQLSVACMKAKVSNTISNLGDNITQELVYAKKVGSILKDCTYESNMAECIPVVYIENSDLNQQDLQDKNCFVANVSGREEIQGKVKDYFSVEQESLNQMDDKEKEAVSKSFNLLAEKALYEAEQNGNTNAKRVFDMIMSLKDKNISMDNL